MPEPDTRSAEQPEANPEEKSTTGWVQPAVQQEDAPDTRTEATAASSTPGPARAERKTDGDTELCRPERPKTDGLPTIPGYHVEAIIGHGGMGVVYRAVDLDLKRQVALKLVFPNGRDMFTVEGRFVREVRSLAAIEHANIVPIYDSGTWNGFPYFTMKYVPGGPLSKQLKRFTSDPTACARLMARVARAVHALHERKVIHRDLKPLNILLGEGDEPLVADFGLARCLDDTDSDLSGTGVPIGTRFYMSPEQARGLRSELTEACDIWALGICLFELLTGVRPFTDDTKSDVYDKILNHDMPALPDTIPEPLVAIVRKCLAKQPADRFSTAAEVADHLEAWLAGTPIPTPQFSKPHKSQFWRRLGIGLVGMVLGGIAIVPFDGNQPSGVTPNVKPPPPQQRTPTTPITPTEWKGKPGEWIDALAREPVTIRWPVGIRNNIHTYDRKTRILRATCDDIGLIALGRTSRNRYEFRVRFEQTPWAGGVGVFFGHGDIPNAEREGQQHHTLELISIPTENSGLMFRLDWLRVSHIGPPGEQRFTSLTYGESDLFFLSPGAHELHVIVNTAGLDTVKLDDRPLPRLSAHQRDNPPPQDSYTGDFGIYLYPGNGTFWNAKYRYHEDQ